MWWFKLFRSSMKRMFRFQFPTFLTASDIFYVLHVTANVAVTENKSSLVFILAPTIASVVDVCNKLIAIKMKRNFFETNNQTLVTSASSSASFYGKEISFPVEIVLLLPLTILIAVLSSILDRNLRFIFVYPFMLFSFCVLIPLYVIIKNDKLRSFTKMRYIEPLKRTWNVFKFNFEYFRRSIKVSPIFDV